MLSELRIVTIDKGQMDAWVDLFCGRIAPLAQRYGIPVTGAWTDVDRERFIQIRSFEDDRHMADRRAQFLNSAEWHAIQSRVVDLTAYQEVIPLCPVSVFGDWDRNQGQVLDDPGPLAQLRMYTINRELMRAWVDMFVRYEVPGHHTAGIPVEWMSTDTEEERFIWIRSFQNKWDMDARQERFHAGIDWQAIKDRVPQMIARAEVILMNPVSTTGG